MYYTRIACTHARSEDLSMQRLSNRRASVPDCIQLNAGDAARSSEVAAAHLRLPPGGQAQDLPLWHHLVCGDREAVHVERISEPAGCSPKAALPRRWEDHLIFRAG